jgi:hypothetical protein
VTGEARKAIRNKCKGGNGKRSPRTNAKIFFEPGNKFTGCIEDYYEDEEYDETNNPQTPFFSTPFQFQGNFNVKPLFRK